MKLLQGRGAATRACKERTNKECLSLISAELYFDSCRDVTMLTRGGVASLLWSPFTCETSEIHICLQVLGRSVATLES